MNKYSIVIDLIYLQKQETPETIFSEITARRFVDFCNKTFYKPIY